MKNNRKIFIPVIALLLALFGHSFYIYRFLKDGTIFTGPNDGLEQMLPMQLYLYQKFIKGEFFYSMDFGLGGDYFTDLAYYYSTNIIYYINIIIVWFLDLFLNFRTDSVTFWAKNAFYVSIFKSSVAILFSYLYFRKIKLNDTSAMLAAFLFVMSAIYFRFTLYWSFFSDVFIFLPLMLLGIEYFIQNKKRSVFIIAVALIFINNFYFAYYHLLAGLIYFIARNIFTSKYDTVKRKVQWIHFVTMSIIGIMISSMFFFYGVKSFLQNERAPYKAGIPLFDPFDQNANIFYDNYLVIVLFLAVQAIFTFKLYDNYFYKFFSIMSIILMCLSFTPFIDSVFNGFSAPQKRWHYLISFFTSGLIGMYIMRFRTIPVKQYLISIVPGSIIVIISHIMIHKAVSWIYIMPVIIIVGLTVLLIQNKKQQQLLYGLMIALILVFNWDVIRVHNKLDNYNPGIDKRAKMTYIESSVYDSPLQKYIINQVKDKVSDDERIDWRVLEQDNTPMYQSFKGVSLYSSIFDGALVDFYFKDLKINLKEESVSRYSTFQSRSNLASLFNVKYLVRKSYQTDIPENFKLIQDDGKYKTYENVKPVPFVRITDKFMNTNDVSTIIDREHAMIEGIVSDDEPTNFKLNHAENLLDQVKITASGASWISDNERLKVNPPSGGLIIEIPEAIKKKYNDFYLDMHVEIIEPITNHQINVNKYANNRLFQTSKYRTHYDDLLYRVKSPDNNKILIGLTPGTYKLTVNGIYGEDYKHLSNVKQSVQYKFKDEGNKMTVSLKSSKDGTMVVPIVYRDGLKAYVDGKKTEVKRGNYIMSTVPVTKDTKTVVFKYTPPYFKLMISLSFVGIILALLYLKFVRLEQHEKNY
ncbi:YfhO family protein [Macrococcus armenti]|uniref:YfhO family protein n=1 Tax=Macrococcus armenti TaxID=2875764 RepID=UPI001CCA6BBC|nr:YfhO family protein [Macrococcus armenti]UBH09538.1 YfhO family protein [Macrococcus armenti]UBH11815.1 YfhO family protein [Macrococcus armenti]